MVSHPSTRARRILRDASLLCAGIGVLLIVGLAVQAYRMREPTLPDPIRATVDEQADITRAVLASGEYSTMPLPPPPQHGEDPWRNERDKVPHVMLLASTLVLCDPDAAADAPQFPCDHHATRDYVHHRRAGLDTIITPVLRRQMIAANLAPSALPDPGYAHSTMLDNEQFAAIMRGDDGWRSFYGTFPQASGVFEITWAVLDESREHALVYAASHCDGLCGTGHYVLLERGPNGWVIKSRFRLWIS